MTCEIDRQPATLTRTKEQRYRLVGYECTRCKTKIFPLGPCPHCDIAEISTPITTKELALPIALPI